VTFTLVIWLIVDRHHLNGVMLGLLLACMALLWITAVAMVIHQVETPVAFRDGGAK
jgi:hypothetical protein